MLRIVWGFLYWNFRKSLYRRGKSKSGCPCQNPSDSGRAGETACDAVLHFAQPARFRVVCPLLKPDARGKMKCSVNRTEVRPFWGRVAGIFVLGSALGYFVLVGGVYLTMRQIGYPITFDMIALPSGWSQINAARSKYFLSKAEVAFQAGELNEAIMALSLAYEYDPTNYEAGLSLAKLWQGGRSDVSNHLYERLMNEHPDQRRRTAQTWLRALLPRADYAAIEQLAANALTFDPDFVPAWVHALLFANQRTGNTELLTRILKRSTDLQPGVREVLTLESEIRARPIAFSQDLLGHPPPTGLPDFVLYYQLRRLIELGGAARAQQLLTDLGSQLTDRDRVTLQLRVLASSPDYRNSYLAAIDQLTRLAPSLVQIDLLCAHFITFPDPEIYGVIKQRIDPMKLPAPADQVSGLVSLFCLAGANKDLPRMEQLAGILRQQTGSKFTALSAAQAMIQDPERVRLEMVLPTLQPISLELTYAMLERFGRRSK